MVKMNKVDIEIYRQIKPTKGLTEVYLGHVQFPWQYAIADYSADRTEGIPFDVFDKVICGILNIDDSLTITQLGNILGMNIEDDIEHGKYRDLAEFEILSEQIQQLIDLGLISFVGGKYHLTESGKESLRVGRKFKTTSGYDFTLYYDLTGGQNDLAKKAFIDAAQTPSHSDSNFNYLDEDCIKSFANNQIENIYSPEEGNSFSNLKVNSVSEFVNYVNVGVVFDFLKDEYRLVFYTPMLDCDLYNNAVNENPSLKAKILDSFIEGQQYCAADKSGLQETFEENAITTQRDIEYKEYLEQDVSIARQTYLESEEIIVPEDFWSDLDSFILPSKPNNVFLNVTNLSVDIIKTIKYWGSRNPDVKVFVAYSSKDDEVKTAESENLYISKVVIADDIICAINGKVLYGTCNYLFNYNDKSYSKSVIRRIDSEQDVTEAFDAFVRSWVPGYLSSFRFQMENGLKNGAFGIDFLLSFDNKLKDFMPYIAQLGLTEDYNSTISTRNQELEKMKQSHEDSLKNEIVEIVGQVKLEELKNLKEIDLIREKLLKIEQECYEDYSEVLSLLNQYSSILKERESFVRDILMAKTYIIDSNIFLDCPDIISKITMPSKVAICAKVTDELDKFKVRSKSGADLHENATKALRNINQALKKEKSKVVLAKADTKFLPPDFSDKSPDNLILCVALMYKEKNPCLLTSDNGLQVKAQICDIPTKTLDEFFEMLEAKKAEKEKGTEVERINVVKTKTYKNNKKNKR